MRDHQEKWDELLEKAEEKRILCKIDSIACSLRSSRWYRIMEWLGIPNAILAAVSSLSIATGDEKTKNASLAISIMVTVMSALLTFLKPSEKAKVFHDASRTYEAMADKYDAFSYKYGMIEGTSLEDGIKELIELNQEDNGMRAKLPILTAGAREKAKKIWDKFTEYKKAKKVPTKTITPTPAKKT